MAVSRNLRINLSSLTKNWRYFSLLTEKPKSQNELINDKFIDESISEDLSSVTPYYPNTFNLASYVNNSEFLQNLLHLNINLSKIEKNPHVVNKILKLNFDDIKKHILFINDFVDKEELGNYLTKNPLILCQPLDDLEVRINYLQSKHFSKSQISRIIQHNPFWLMFSTLRIDRRLGYYQQKFGLCGDEVRFLATKQPRLITYSLHHVTTNTFVIKEEMGFEESEVKKLLLDKPRLWMMNQRALLERFNLLHNTIKIPHSTILQQPEILLCRSFKVKQRYLFLQKLGRAQFDPTKENYVPIMALAEGRDVDFCKLYAKCNINDFNVFLKTL
ncbi:transcription termination factor 3, mitochondrial [Ostrinia nubilalis]|uniref:transcription termination factor 3, mitochondrial n=1 Tax=Ostrinia nubilalis TaxID=29057 RepID=UPI00308262F7